MPNKTQLNYDNYKRIRNERHALLRTIKNEHWECFSERMEHDFYGLQKEICRFHRKSENGRKGSNETKIHRKRYMG